MRDASLELSSFSARGLNLLAQLFGEADARVVLAERARFPLTVSLESRTIVLHPQRAGLYDLPLGAQLLVARPLIAQGPANPELLDRWLTLKARRHLVPAAHERLRAQYPQILRLPGRFKPGAPVDELQLVRQSVEWDPLQLPESAGATSLAAEHIPELQLTGADDDYRELLRAIEGGRIATATLPGLDDLPYVRVPLAIAATQRFPLLEEWERQLADPENQELLADLMRCQQRKSIVREERSQSGRHRHSGAHLDWNRVVDAIVGARKGISVPVFRQPGSTIEPVFDPSQHLVVLTFDMNDLRGLDWHGGRAAVLRFLAVLITCYQRLHVDVVVQGTADQLLELADERTVCLHCRLELKSFDEPFDEVFWNRLALLMRKPPALPGEAACFHPLSAEDIAHTFNDVAATHNHSYRTMVWWARRLIPSRRPEFREREFLERCAGHVDHVMGELERELDGTFDTLPSFLPDELRSVAAPGGYLHSCTF